ncbi:hypothetical protein F0L74_06905 [Chitinophaga agrisoli]|uniref:Uncharacterized protein n=1 Tax=Chitinophaga agrisoli TaxID=2607653 RepID=A0A5B2W491_9BACT|nr:hypothetical protein [Chitinophaga agrisoli]KAA2245678.1 hypothetical protein F0L74_06905 [Chitinophaga agrisoli]
MATQTSVIKFTGKLGDIIGYRCGKKHHLRTRPEHIHQTAATKQAAQNFGINSRKSKIIRKAILPHLDLRYDGTTGNRLTRELILAGKQPPKSSPTKAPHKHSSDHLQALLGFRFNHHTGINNILLEPPVITPDGQITLPAQFIRQPGSAGFIEVKAIAVRINFTERRVVSTDEAIELIDLSQSFSGTTLKIDTSGKGTLFIVLQLRACISCNGAVLPLGDRRYNAADIIAVTPQQKPNNNDKKPRRKQLSYTTYTGRHTHHMSCIKPAALASFDWPNNQPAAYAAKPGCNTWPTITDRQRE